MLLGMAGWVGEYNCVHLPMVVRVLGLEERLMSTIMVVLQHKAIVVVEQDMVIMVVQLLVDFPMVVVELEKLGVLMQMVLVEMVEIFHQALKHL